jgi:hypothetical protein
MRSVSLRDATAEKGVELQLSIPFFILLTRPVSSKSSFGYRRPIWCALAASFENRAMTFESPMQVLHWLPEEDRWELIGWANWVAFVWPPQACLPGVPAGIHYFIVCIHHDGAPLNLILHKYLIDPDGRIGADNFAGLSRTERDDYRRLMLLREPRSSDMAQLHELRQKMRAANFPCSATIWMRTASGDQGVKRRPVAAL